MYTNRGNVGGLKCSRGSRNGIHGNVHGRRGQAEVLVEPRLGHDAGLGDGEDLNLKWLLILRLTSVIYKRVRHPVLVHNLLQWF